MIYCVQLETKYARSGKVSIAYQVTGEGPLDLVLTPGFVSHVEYRWEEPGLARFYRRLASFSRLITFDKRGTGLSDRVPDAELPTLEQRMDDLRAVMDAAGSKQAALFGISEGGPLSALFAATYPERTVALIMYGAYIRGDADFSGAPTKEEQERKLEMFAKQWGGEADLTIRAPSVANDERFKKWFATYLRMSASPAAALALVRMNFQIDVTDVLSAIRVPTLILHRSGDRLINVQSSRDMAKRIPGARYVELPGDDHIPYVGDEFAICSEIQEFLTGVQPGADLDRVLSTVLFVDIVGSTEQAATLGDRRWSDLLDGYYSSVRREISRFRGREVDTAGDGVFACFDGPARAIRCALAIRDEVRELGITIRAGLHTGECEVIGDKLGGIAVHIGARIAAHADASEILVSSTVKDLVAGSGLSFVERGSHELKGVPDRWRLFAIS